MWKSHVRGKFRDQNTRINAGILISWKQTIEERKREREREREEKIVIVIAAAAQHQQLITPARDRYRKNQHLLDPFNLLLLLLEKDEEEHESFIPGGLDSGACCLERRER